MEDEVIPDSAIKASSKVNQQHEGRNARLHFKGGLGRVAAWAALENNELQWLQVTFGKWTKVAGVAIQGRHTVEQWVETFTISFSFDGLLFKDYREQGHKKVSNSIKVFYSTQFYTSIRFFTNTSQETFLLPCMWLSSTCFIAQLMEQCIIIAGVLEYESRSNLNLFSAFFFHNCSSNIHDCGDLSSIQCFIHSSNTRCFMNKQLLFLAIAFLMFVSSFSSPLLHQVFSGNSDWNNVVSQRLEEPITTRYIRIHPVTWHVHIAMRVEFYGCLQGRLNY